MMGAATYHKPSFTTIGRKAADKLCHYICAAPRQVLGAQQSSRAGRRPGNSSGGDAEIVDIDRPLGRALCAFLYYCRGAFSCRRITQLASCCADVGFGICPLAPPHVIIIIISLFSINSLFRQYQMPQARYLSSIFSLHYRIEMALGQLRLQLCH